MKKNIFLVALAVIGLSACNNGGASSFSIPGVISVTARGGGGGEGGECCWCNGAASNGQSFGSNNGDGYVKIYQIK